MQLEHIPVTMIAPQLAACTQPALPPGYSLCYFSPGDEQAWAEIEAGAGEFSRTEQALDHFASEFGLYIDALRTRCLFLTGSGGRKIGTATAWYSDDFRGGRWGRLHWVAIHRDYQGRGLARPLVTAAVNRLSQLHARAYLTSQTTSYKAIKLYLDYGFAPDMSTPRAEDAWHLLASVVNHPQLAAYL